MNNAGGKARCCAVIGRVYVVATQYEFALKQIFFRLID
jgi:hypothetical protein